MEHGPEADSALYAITREQKIGMILLLIFGVLAIGLGGLSIRNTLYAPFALNKKIPPTLKREVATVDALRWRDTDRDAITDFDELYVYATSPYLADTDSDGISDSEEVTKGSDPLCPRDQDCSRAVETVTALPSGSISSTLNTLPVSAEEIGPPPPDLDVALNDPMQIRAMLAGVGMDPKALKQISDVELLEMVRQVINVSNTPFNYPDFVSSSRGR